MFIREIKKKNPGYKKAFTYHRLMESVRTPKGPRQRVVLNLGKLDIPRDRWKLLANRIEEIVSGQETFIAPPLDIEDIARHYANMLIEKELQGRPGGRKEDSRETLWETVDLNSISKSQGRTIGGEALGWHAFKKLRFPQILGKLGFTPLQVQHAALLIIGRLLHPASERETARWAKETSALDELIGADFRHLSNNALYRASDLLMRHRQSIETHLATHEKSLLGLSENIILYDLTNTYFEGNATGSKKARRGYSKEKRHGCPLLTLALVLDEDGFPKGSRTFEGNISEPATLKKIVSQIGLSDNRQLSLGGDDAPTVVIDAGIGTSENLSFIKSRGYHYITVSKTRPDEIPQEGLFELETRTGGKISLKKMEQDGEVFLFCRSPLRMKKEEAMKSGFMKRFEEGLKNIESSLGKPRGHKKYDQVMKRIGRLQQKYSRIARFYAIDVTKKGQNASSIKWGLDESKKVQMESRFSGTYYVRTDRMDLSEEELWRIYTMLTQVEDAFRYLKSELGLRPNYHQKDGRMEGHIFISVLAYHLLAFLQRELRAKGIHHRWWTIRNVMSSQTRVTTSITVRGGVAANKRDENKVSAMCHVGKDSRSVEYNRTSKSDAAGGNDKIGKGDGTGGNDKIGKGDGTGGEYGMGDEGRTGEEYGMGDEGRTGEEYGMGDEGKTNGEYGMRNVSKTGRSPLKTNCSAARGANDRSGNEGRRVHIRQTLDPEPHHLEIYRALGLHPTPLSPKRTFL